MTGVGHYHYSRDGRDMGYLVGGVLWAPFAGLLASLPVA
jgi:hypothetical protein